jgi:hypothetical protein
MFTPVGTADETDILAVGLSSGAQPESCCMLANLVFSHVADRETRVF